MEAMMDLTDAEKNEYQTGGKGQPKIGGSHRLFHLPGLWYVWSKGPEPGTWWIFPVDDEGKAADVKEAGEHVKAVSGEAIAVKTKEFR